MHCAHGRYFNAFMGAQRGGIKCEQSRCHTLATAWVTVLLLVHPSQLGNLVGFWSDLRSCWTRTTPWVPWGHTQLKHHTGPKSSSGHKQLQWLSTSGFKQCCDLLAGAAAGGGKAQSLLWKVCSQNQLNREQWKKRVNRAASRKVTCTGSAKISWGTSVSLTVFTSDNLPKVK